MEPTEIAQPEVAQPEEVRRAQAMVRAAIGERLSPYGAVNWPAVDAAVLDIHDEGEGHIVIHVDSDRNAVVAETVLAALGAVVRRDESYDPFAPGHTGIRLVAEIK
ncbi:hypothetical protein [Tenggerimyces flavus]|uniref:Uncharacterized protein n=1 Tax=Tenggerimyces flavus TaxID=1708749 RepID=A0ABV7Y378_9ACTN|nr:hypothetical protein [Tenggerimyces flavus]MBM7790062.1 hypothetical protein [Tenggerimyces flavus]